MNMYTKKLVPELPQHFMPLEKIDGNVTNRYFLLCFGNTYVIFDKTNGSFSPARDCSEHI